MGIGSIRLPKLRTHPLLLYAELGPEPEEQQDETDNPAHLGKRNRGAKKPGQNAGVDGVTDQGIGAGGNQLVALLNGYRAAPVASELLARPDGEQKAGDGDGSSNRKGPDARRPELPVEPGQRDAICREEYDHDQEGEGPQDARGGRLDALSGFGTGGLDPPIEKKGDPHHGKERFKEPEHSGPSRRCLPLNDTYTSKSDDVITPYQPDISDNVGSVNLSLKRTSPFTSKSVFVRRVLCPSVDNHGSPVIFRSLSVRPTHLFDPISDHDYSFKLPLARERDAHSYDGVLLHAVSGIELSRVRTELDPAEYSQPFRHIQYNRTRVSGPWPLWRYSFAGAAPGAYAVVSGPHHIAPRLGLLPPARNATRN
jgi:hypothetical protein